MHVTVVMVMSMARNTMIVAVIIFIVKMMGHDGSPAVVSTAREQPR